MISSSSGRRDSITKGRPSYNNTVNSTSMNVGYSSNSITKGSHSKRDLSFDYENNSSYSKMNSVLSNTQQQVLLCNENQTPNRMLVSEAEKENKAIQFQQKTPKDVEDEPELEITRTFDRNEITDIIRNITLNKDKDFADSGRGSNSHRTISNQNSKNGSPNFEVRMGKEPLTEITNQQLIKPKQQTSPTELLELEEDNQYAERQNRQAKEIEICLTEEAEEDGGVQVNMADPYELPTPSNKFEIKQVFEAITIQPEKVE